MKKFILLSAAMMLGIMLSAQTQQGYVKTKGRMMNGRTNLPRRIYYFRINQP